MTATNRRTRARSPFLPTPKERGKLDRNAPLAQALRQLPETLDDLDRPINDLLPVRISGVRVDLTQAQIDQAVAMLEKLKELKVDAYAPNSRRGMHSDWRHWIAFCAQRDRVAMPISFDDLSEFVEALIIAGYKRASIEHILFTLSEASRVWDCPNPTDTHLWKAYWRDRRRTQLAKRQQQAQSLNIGDVDDIASALDTQNARSIRDALFAACAYDMLARASELVAMRWDGITFDVDADGGATYLIERAKSDQEGQGALTYLTPETVQLLMLWQAHRNAENDHVFHALPRYKGHAIDTTKPLNVREASRIFDRLAKTTGIGKALSGHSARVGGAQDMTRAGMDLPAIMQAGRWKSPQMPARYAENELATRRGKSRREAIRKLGR